MFTDRIGDKVSTKLLLLIITPLLLVVLSFSTTVYPLLTLSLAVGVFVVTYTLISVARQTYNFINLLVSLLLVSIFLIPNYSVNSLNLDLKTF